MTKVKMVLNAQMQLTILTSETELTPMMCIETPTSTGSAAIKKTISIRLDNYIFIKL